MAVGRQKILLVTDDDGFARNIHKHLGDNGYDVVVAPDTGTAVAVARQVTPSMIMVDRRLSPIAQMRSDVALRKLPFVAVQPPGMTCGEEECQDDLEQEVDMVVCSQGYRELIARVRAVLRREQFQSSPKSLFVAGGLRVDVDRHEVVVDGRHVELTPKEFQILQQLMLQPQRVFSRDELLTKVWGPDTALEEHTLDVHVHSLRQKIETDPAHPRYIVTVRGVGYKLKAD